MVHLNTLVGGRNVSILRPLLEHYRNLGVESYIINIHLNQEGDPILEEITSITKDFGVPIASVSVGSWLEILRRVYRESRTRYPNDWHILADQDEFQVYPMGLSELEAFCEERGFDYVRGCWVDRLAADGGFPQLDCYSSLWDQCPVGAFLSYPIGAADPRKVVFAKSHVDVCVGQHLAWNGTGCPISEAFIQIHHFKWVEGIIAELEARAGILKHGGYGFHVESSRFVKYFQANNGLVNLEDRRLLATKCGQDYPHWPLIQRWFMLLNNYVELGRRFIPGPASLTLEAETLSMDADRLRANLASATGSDSLLIAGRHDPTFGLEPLREIWFKTRN